jgi:hypothetical protein
MTLSGQVNKIASTCFSGTTKFILQCSLHSTASRHVPVRCIAMLFCTVREYLPRVPFHFPCLTNTSTIWTWMNRLILLIFWLLTCLRSGIILFLKAQGCGCATCMSHNMRVLITAGRVYLAFLYLITKKDFNTVKQSRYISCIFEGI